MILHKILCIALTMAALNALKVMAADVMNAYITAPNKEKIYMLLGSEFGRDKCCKALVVRALYELKSASVEFRSHLANCMRQFGYESNKADPDLWMKVSTWDFENGPRKYYLYILIYIDDIL